MKRSNLGIVAGIIVALCAPLVSFASNGLGYGPDTVFCGTGWGDTDYNGTYVYQETYQWDGQDTWSHDDVTFFATGCLGTCLVLAKPVALPSIGYPEYSYVQSSGVLAGPYDVINDGVTPTGTFAIGACEGAPLATASSTATTSDISFLLGIFLVLAFYAFIAHLYRAFFFSKSQL